LALVIGISVGASVFIHGLTNDSIEQKLVETSKNLNARLPVNVDSETRWDSTFAGPGTCLTYCYTLVNLSKSEVDPNEITLRMKPKLLEAYKTSPDMALFRDKHVTVRFQYKDKAGESVTVIEVSPADL